MIVSVKAVSKSMTFGAIDPKTNKFKAKYDGCFDKWIPGISKVTGVLNTGLDKENEASLEKSCGLPAGTLARHSSYWDTFFIVIPSEGIVLNTEIPEHELHYMLLKADPTVVETSKEELVPLSAEFVMFTQEQKASSANEKRDILAKAMKYYSELTQDQILGLLLMYGKNGANLSPDIAKNTIGDEMDKDPKRFIALMEDKGIQKKIWIKKLIKLGILTKVGVGKGDEVPIYFNDLCLGQGLEAAVTFLSDKENNNVLVALKKQQD
jgi:hypothetical protein